MPDPSPPTLSDATRGGALAAALAAVDALAELGETVEDEWSYVTALAEAGRARLRAAAGPDTALPIPGESGLAVATACAEVSRITDPHRAIDWLSTFPAVVELVLADAPTTTDDASRAAGDTPRAAGDAPGTAGDAPGVPGREA
jgi:hypothetical protein